MSGRLRTAGLWLVGCVVVLVVTSLVASIGTAAGDGPGARTAGGIRTGRAAGFRGAGAAPAQEPARTLRLGASARGRRVNVDLQRARHHGPERLRRRPRGAARLRRGAPAAHRADRGAAAALGGLAAARRTGPGQRVLQNLPPAVLATVGSEVALQLVELETIALARRVTVLGEAASSDDRTVIALTNRLERLVRRAEGALINLRRAAGTG